MASFQEVQDYNAAALEVALDDELFASFLALAETDEPTDDDYVLLEDEWLEKQDRFVYARFEDGVWPATADRKQSVSELLCRVGARRSPPGTEGYPPGDRSLFVRARFSGDDDSLSFYIPAAEGGAAYAEERLSRALASVGRDDGLVEVYVAPPPARGPLKKDAWWSRNYVRTGAKGAARGNPSYDHYRRTIDGLLLDALQQALPEQGGRVAELCAGDGSLAARALAERPDVAAYVMLERNAKLVALAEAKTAAAAATAAVRAVRVDACEPGAIADALGGLAPDVFVASGSVLCGQVGSPSMARPVLEAMVEATKPGGRLLITGFTQSFLRPRLFEDLRLDVELASVSSDEVDDLASGFGRFHVFLLRKCDRAPGAPANSLRGAILGPEDGLPADLPDLEPAAVPLADRCPGDDDAADDSDDTLEG